MPPPPPIPVSRYLIPASVVTIPEGFTLVNQKITNGVPFAIRLDASTNLVGTVPTGSALRWNQMDPATVVSQSDPETQPFTDQGATPIGDVTRLPFRLYLQKAGTTVASLSATAGIQRVLPENPAQTGATPMEVILLSWILHAGTLRGPGDFGSGIQLGWRLAGQAGAFFSPLPVNPFARTRIESRVARVRPELLVESVVGVKLQVAPERFKLKRVILL